MTTRREFLQVMAVSSGALVFGIRLEALAEESATTPFRPNAWLRIEPDGWVVVQVGKSEMGQGVRTALPMMLADELDADLDRIRVEQASPGPDFTRLGTGGSGSCEGSWMPLRHAGAAARAMLAGAAAARWGVAPDACRTESGAVVHGEKRLAYSALLTDAAKQPLPEKPQLKKRDAFRVVGTSRKRIDGSDIVTGKARFGLDVRVPGMLYAAVSRPPAFGSKLASFDAKKARAIPRVREVVEIPTGVAVVAENTWAALRGREALEIEWTPSKDGEFDSASHMKVLEEITSEPGITIRKDGRGREGFVDAARTLESVYLYPFAAHASVEPVNATARVSEGKCEVWTPTQTPNAVQGAVAQLLGIQPADVTVHVELLGGGFGRRLGHDFDREAVEVARRMQGIPVQVFWSREDDMRHGYFQAASAHRMRAGLDAGGKVVAWEHRKATTPHNARRQPTEEQKRDPNVVAGWAWGVNDSPYGFRDAEMTYTVVDAPVPIGPWRSVFSPSSVFARESFLDEIALATGKDPLRLRLELLGEGDESVPATYSMGERTLDRTVLRRVLHTVAEKSGWSKPLPAGRVRGLAANVFHNDAAIAYVVELSARSGTGLPFTIHRVVCAIDCGLVVNPNGVAQQVESGVLWSLSNMKGETTFRQGTAREEQFADFAVAMMEDTPAIIETHLVESTYDAPRGVGEPTVCPFAPAVANALSRLTGKRVRRLPVVS